MTKETKYSEPNQAMIDAMDAADQVCIICSMDSYKPDTLCPHGGYHLNDPKIKETP